MTTKTTCTRCGGEQRRDAAICIRCEKAIKREQLERFGRITYGKPYAGRRTRQGVR